MRAGGALGQARELGGLATVAGRHPYLGRLGFAFFFQLAQESEVLAVGRPARRRVARAGCYLPHFPARRRYAPDARLVAFPLGVDVDQHVSRFGGVRAQLGVGHPGELEQVRFADAALLRPTGARHAQERHKKHEGRRQQSHRWRLQWLGARARILGQIVPEENGQNAIFLPVSGALAPCNTAIGSYFAIAAKLMINLKGYFYATSIF